MDRTAQFYSGPSYGGGIPIFTGARRQRGGSILGALKSFFVPLVSGFAKKGARAAMNVAQNVVGDAISGRNVKTSLKQHGIKAAKRLGGEMLSSAVGQMNSVLGPNIISRKRPAPRKAKQSAKRRKRGNF